MDETFQTLETTQNKIFKDGEIVSDFEWNTKITYGTWSHFIHSPKNTLYASVWSSGDDVAQYLGEHDKAVWEALTHRRDAFLKSYRVCGTDLRRVSIMDILPNDFVSEYLAVKDVATQNIFAEVRKPENYDLMSDIHNLIEDISMRKISIDFASIKQEDRNKRFFNLSRKNQNFVSYNMFGSVTGRLTTNQNSFPILNLDTSLRKMVQPRNHFFLEFDYNSAEARVLASLAGVDVGEQDIHSWMAENMFGGCSRDEVKKSFFAWLYNPLRKHAELDSIYNRDEILNKYYKNNMLKTPFGRSIKCDDFHALNYLIQSASSDNTLQKATQIHQFLSNKKTFISFMIHDSIILDFHSDDVSLIPEIREIIENTQFGKMKTNMSSGKTFGDMVKSKESQ